MLTLKGAGSVTDGRVCFNKGLLWRNPTRKGVKLVVLSPWLVRLSPEGLDVNGIEYFELENGSYVLTLWNGDLWINKIDKETFPYFHLQYYMNAYQTSLFKFIMDSE